MEERKQFGIGLQQSNWERSLYAEAQAVQEERGLSPIMLPGYIRSEVVMPATTTGFTFPIRSDESFNGQAVQNQESRLNINDAFYMTHLSVMFYTFITATGNPARVRAALQTFPNTTVFTTNAPEVEAMYNGSLSLKVDSTTFIDRLDMNAFRFSEYAQQGLLVFTASTNGSNVWRNSEMFKMITSPLVRLNGAGKNEFALTFPDTVASNLVAGSSLGAVLYLRGWKAQNGGAFRPGSR